ncbi:MAG TPA: hypothetical protein VFF65_05870 [Phycisphaerales bacterium]|nr:hypothetical protein [Phycisphaerales bacterium]
MHKTLRATLVFPLLCLAGCTADYAANVRNRCAQPVSVELISPGPNGETALLAPSLRLGPGDRGGVGPVRIDQQRTAVLRVDFAGNPGRPALITLTPGTTTAEVTQEGATANAPLNLRPVTN